jgi:CrcB protein
VRPFLGVGVLGGYTTFSTYAVQTHSLLRAHRPGLALAYLLGTLLAAMVGVAVGVAAARGLVRLRGARRHDEEAR